MALSGGGSAGSVVGPVMMSWQAYPEPAADLRSDAAQWGKAEPARQGKVEEAARFGIHQRSGPEWVSEIADDSSPWKEV